MLVITTPTNTRCLTLHNERCSRYIYIYIYIHIYKYATRQYCLATIDERGQGPADLTATNMSIYIKSTCTLIHVVHIRTVVDRSVTLLVLIQQQCTAAVYNNNN